MWLLNALAIAPNAALVAAGTADSRLFLWNATDVKPVSQNTAHAGPVTAVAFHPQGTQLLTAGGDGLLKLWALPPVPSRALTHPDANKKAVFWRVAKNALCCDSIRRSFDNPRWVAVR